MNDSKAARVEDWLDKQPSRPTQHYRLEDEDEEIIGEAESFTPRGFKERLQACPSCHKRTGDPKETLKCLNKVHTKHFCFHCFDIMPYQSEKIAYHNVLKGHFSDTEQRLVPCPFSTCPDSGCFDQSFYYMSGLRSHIYKDHLPDLDRIIASTENFGDTEIPEDDKIKPDHSHSSGYASATTVDLQNENMNWISSSSNNHSPPPPQELAGQHASHREGPKIKRSPSWTSFNNTIQNKSIKKSSSSKKSFTATTTSNNSSKKLRQSSTRSHSPTPTLVIDAYNDGATNAIGPQQPFQCSLCKKSFRYRRALGFHKLKQTCDFFIDKFCHHCEVAFDGFSIQSCILHLKLHQEQEHKIR